MTTHSQAMRRTVHGRILPMTYHGRRIRLSVAGDIYRGLVCANAVVWGVFVALAVIVAGGAAGADQASQLPDTYAGEGGE